METETLCNYEQPQDKHILEDSINDDIQTNHDDNSNSLPINEIDETNSVGFTEPVTSSNKKDNEENCNEIVSSTGNKTSTDNFIECNNEESQESKSPFSNIQGTNVSSTNEEEAEKTPESGQEDILTTERENGSPSENQNEGSLSASEEKNETESLSASEEKNETESLSASEEKNETESLSASEEKNETQTETDHKTQAEQDLPDEENQENGTIEPTTNKNQDISENKSASTEVESTEQEGSEQHEENSGNNKMNTDLGSNDTVKDVTKENENKEKTPDETAANSDKKNAGGEDWSLLKETLTKPQKADGTEDNEPEGENGTDEIEMDDDFDPSLLCPDIAMEVDEAPVITTTDNLPPDGNKSPLLYEPVYSTYVDEMTGAEVTFNLTPEEQQLRQETYGEKNPIQFTRIHCTACNVHLGSALDGQTNRFVHPLLKVLICKDCYHFYTSGEFEKDEDGSELYCRWCGQGGQVMCCSSCEMVFCKKCIRINFGRKKLTEIRDSDDWYCFRCNPIQLTSLRVHCAEFMEYVRRETSRAATLENATSFMTTDYTKCCLFQKKKYVEPPSSTEPKKKRKKTVDPDYEPDLGQPDSPNHVNSSSDPNASKVVPILPKPADPNHNAGVVTQVSQIDAQGRTVYKMGNTIFRPRGTTMNQIRPVFQPGNSTVRPQATTGYIKIMPGGIRTITPSTRPAQTFNSTTVRQQPGFQQRPMKTVNPPTMKHEWFEKTVRAAARVNSNLSYTLTQLNRAQSTASSVEALAVVHNKLQEILSTSINSLIQIRKNLRTEFIAGIKNIRFPPKPQQPRPLPSTSSQDDDVIFVSPTSSPIPPPLPITTSNNLTSPNNVIPTVILAPASMISKQKSPIIVPTTSLEPIPSTSTSTDSGVKPKMFLRVKSLSALQNVPSECITIPDDPVPVSQPPPLAPIILAETFTVVEDSPEKNKVIPVEEPVEANKEETLDSIVIDTENKDDDSESKTTEPEIVSKDLPVLRQLVVYLDRSAKIDALARSKFGIADGDSSE